MYVHVCFSFSLKSMIDVAIIVQEMWSSSLIFQRRLPFGSQRARNAVCLILSILNNQKRNNYMSNESGRHVSKKVQESRSMLYGHREKRRRMGE